MYDWQKENQCTAVHTDFQNWCPLKTNWYPLKINQLIKSVYIDFISVHTEFSHWFSKTGISVHTDFQKLVPTENKLVSTEN